VFENRIVELNKMQLKEAVKDVKLHGIKCYSITARGIKCISHCDELKKLGVVRYEKLLSKITFYYFIGQ
jgi:hypothetical protein